MQRRQNEHEYMGKLRAELCVRRICTDKADYSVITEFIIFLGPNLPINFIVKY